MPKKTLAVVTMVYNEPDLLPVWKAYYGRQVGIENCYVVNHGSDDGSVESLSFPNLINLPRTDLDEIWRGKLVRRSATACCLDMTTSPTPTSMKSWWRTPGTIGT